jgi:hypothetical protein
MGNNTKTQDTTDAPDLQIKFKIHVQKIIYNTLITNNNEVFDTSQE